MPTKQNTQSTNVASTCKIRGGRTKMLRVLSNLRNSPIACSFSMAFGIGVMLSVAYLDPDNKAAIALRHAVGGFFLLLPGVVNRIELD